jgi:hypothetical protein
MFHRTAYLLSALLIAQSCIIFEKNQLKDKYNPSIHCRLQHKDFSSGLNIYFSEQYEISSTLTVNVYYWFLYSKHHTQCILFTAKDTSSHHLILLMLSSIELNPGPRRPRFPCCICDKACKTNVIACDDCDMWIHKSCLGMTTDEFNNIGNSDEK